MKKEKSVKKTLDSNVLEKKYENRRFDINDEKTVDYKVLESIPFEYTGSDTEVIYETDEFTTVCPWTGLPDFANLSIEYSPDKKLVELKSLKYYLTSYRNVGILQEHAVNKVLNDLVKLLAPCYMVVEAEYKERGGILTRVSSTYEKI